VAAEVEVARAELGRTLVANLRSHLADEAASMDAKFAHQAGRVRPSEHVELDPRLDLDGNFVDDGAD
jgi:hypothetical protein